MAALTVTTKNLIRTVTMDRPESLNSFNADMMDELCHSFLDAASDDSVRVLVLTGAGRAFSAGADLKSMGTPPDPLKKDLQALMHSIIDFPKPFITAANGLGVGIGMTIHGVADLVFMAKSARFRAPFSSLGLTAEAASTYTFSRLLGHQQASWALLSGEWFRASECLDMGLALEVIPDEKLMTAPHIEAIKYAIKKKELVLQDLQEGPLTWEQLEPFSINATPTSATYNVRL